MWHYRSELGAARLHHPLTRLAHNVDASVRAATLAALHTLLASGVISSAESSDFLPALLPRLHDTVPAVARAATAVLSVLPLDSIGHTPSAVTGAQSLGLKRALSTAPRAADFGRSHFVTLLPPLLERAAGGSAAPAGGPLGDTRQLAALLHACHILSASARQGATAPHLEHGADTLQFAALLHCARLCTESNLTTPLGRADKTLAAIERSVREVARAVEEGTTRVVTVAIRRHATDGAADAAEGGASASVALERRACVQALLVFVDVLERQLFHAIEGTAALPPTPTPSLLFFRANGAVCREWLLRLRAPLTLACAAAGRPSGVAYHGTERLRHLRHVLQMQMQSTRSPKGTRVELERTALAVAEALVALRQEDALRGLHHWARSVGSSSSSSSLSSGAGAGSAGAGSAAASSLPWLAAAAEEAAGHLEQAATAYGEYLTAAVTPAGEGNTTSTADKSRSTTRIASSSTAPGSACAGVSLELADAGAVAFAAARRTQCHVALGDWDGLAAWHEELAGLRTRVEAEAAAQGTKGRRYAEIALAMHATLPEQDAVHDALARFDQGDWAGAEACLVLPVQAGTDWDVAACERQASECTLRAMLAALYPGDDAAAGAREQVATAAHLLSRGIVDGMLESADVAGVSSTMHASAALLRRCLPLDDTVCS